VNLFLGVGAVRVDGYHDVTTVLHAIELADTLRIATAEALTLSCEPAIGIPAEENLAYRAAVALGDAVGREPRVALSLTKRTPHGAGLGGGSSDAAAVIAGLAHLWEIDRLDPRCISVAASLGSDVPFFLGESGAALMTGRGDELARELPALPGTPIALVRPPLPVSTAAAYAAFDSAPVAAGDPAEMLAALAASDSAAVGAAIANNLVDASSAVVPEVAVALAWTCAQDGVLGATVAGSGSAVFAVCDSHEAARTIASTARQHGAWATATALRPCGVEIVDESEGRE